jgi:hypothetical protein
MTLRDQCSGFAAGPGEAWWYAVTGPSIAKLETGGGHGHHESVVHAYQESEMNHLMKAFMAASVIALGMAGPMTAVRAAGTGAAYETIDHPTDEQLQRYASAVHQVSDVVAEYQPRLQAAQGDAAKQAVRVEADQKMVDRVEAGGMSVAEYNGISQAVRKDPELRKKVERLVGKQ